MTDQRVLSGIVHLWSYQIARTPAPRTLAGEEIAAAAGAGAGKATDPPTWFQGHIFPSQRGGQQYALLGVPAAHPPPIHGCMVSEHDRPMYYDVYIADYADGALAIAGRAKNVARSGGSGDAVELVLEGGGGAGGPPPQVQELRMSTTRLLSGDRAASHLLKYAPDALIPYRGDRMDAGGDTADIVVCLGVISVAFVAGQ
ncbi:hypothetical protein IWQ56_001804 [Coemansia nantahalensis]|uniref:Uncharacterized protein n=1 Tax=Coemansia nantahalensis TaxID=2789366 RepID=A0ACC1JWE7_9FUNG|nr:hypothetical protein IWQ57_003550 [Coemansia nantahalensis]KAJ2771387.1 hypothetical protein IWQ56_001804 [Coemansia nantahalensis]